MSFKNLLIISALLPVFAVYSRWCDDFDSKDVWVGQHEVKYWCKANDPEAKQKRTANSCDCNSPVSPKCRTLCKDLKEHAGDKRFKKYEASRQSIFGDDEPASRFSRFSELD